MVTVLQDMERANSTPPLYCEKRPTGAPSPGGEGWGEGGRNTCAGQTKNGSPSPSRRFSKTMGSDYSPLPIMNFNRSATRLL